MKNNVLLIIPAYNEEKNIGKVLSAYHNSKLNEFTDLLVINDGSKDKTEEIAKSYGAEVITQIYNMGYGAALQTGYKYASEKGYEYLIQLDADGQHDLKNVKLIYDKLTKNEKDEELPDIVIGSRYLEGSVSFDQSGIRLSAVKFFRFIIKKSTGHIITDPTSGLQGMNRKAFKYFSGYVNFDIKYPDINMILQMLLIGFEIKEIPAIMHERTEGVAMHHGILKPIKYMMLMMISTMGVLVRSY